MYRGSSSRIVPIILVLVIIAIVITIAVSIIRAIFGGDSSQPSVNDNSRQELISTSADRSVRMTVRGPIIANEQFRSYQVTVSPESRNLTTYSGYLGQAIDTKALGNNTIAYEEFVYALDRANLVKGTPLSGDKDDTRGICATGYVYEFEARKANTTVKRLWTSTCSGSRGSLDANLNQVKNLFLRQIPNNNLISSSLVL